MKRPLRLLTAGLAAALFLFACDTGLNPAGDTPISYNLTFDPNGGTGDMSAQSFTTGETQPLNTNAFTRSGYVFDSWANSADGSVAYDDGADYTMGTADATLFAHWTLRDYTSSEIGTLKYVPAGRFQFDSTATNISVINKPYRLSQHEITRQQFLGIMGTDPSDTSKSSGLSDPVQRVNWYHVIAFANKLSLVEDLTPVYAVTVSGTAVDWSTLAYGAIPTADNADWNAATTDWNANGYRLPTEMEWMWAAMGAPADGQNGGTNTTGYQKAFAGSTGSNEIGDYSWYSSNSGNTTHPVGTKTANELGLYDMSGNLLEWCWDRYDTYPTGILPDYRGPDTGAFRMTRGGAFSFVADALTVAIRNQAQAPRNNTEYDIGFRLVRP
jgi:uncharacterized repeat protein (TIGR02543 family)